MGGGGSPDDASLRASPRKDSFLKFSIDHPAIKFELETSRPEEALTEVRRIIEALHASDAFDGAMPEDDEGLYDLKVRLSDEFFRNPALRSRMENALVLDEDVQIVKRVLPILQEYDLESGSHVSQVMNVQESLRTLFDAVPCAVRDCLVHIRGELSQEQQHAIMDAIRQRLGVAVSPRFFSTRKNLEGNVLVEAVCFGTSLGKE